MVVTQTYSRPERLAEMTRYVEFREILRLSQTLMHVRDILWVVVEEGRHTVSGVEALLRRSRHPYAYLTCEAPRGYRRKFFN